MEQNKTNFLTSDNEAIIAHCTPKGSGAIAVLRLCGQNAIFIADKIAKLSCGKKLKDCQSHTINHGYVINYEFKEVIDEVLFLLMQAPKTFTGQDTVEINCHNNAYIIEKIIQQAINAGARLADRGEFTKRAFLNNKIDLIQAEAINDVINAQTENALHKSMSQLQGSLSFYLQNLQDDIVGLLSLSESSFEFLEEEQQDLGIDNIFKDKILQIINNLEEIKNNFSQQQQIKNGIKISIIGGVNLGKSTLFNALLKKNRAIVTNIEGTTRDVIESSIYKNGNFWLLTDTAGLRQTEDIIEKEGIEKTWQESNLADIILLVFDLSKNLSKQELEIYKNIIKKHDNKIIFVGNKSDQENNAVLNKLDFLENKNILKISALNKIGISKLESEIEIKIQDIFSKLQSPFLLNQRQYNLLLEVANKLKFVEKSFVKNIEYELISYHLKEILERLSELTGKNVTEKVLDRVFSDFCVGK
ncbi:tRNA uridine-5-carboxymethylaminomethyl(34) synthesis GTPase MnmE [Candidatus Babeliales bacterium]|nr:tRNA uridine-5-carboxymethylaminomethyl(34) synthesis GTPase MnmE [Candidatus Babeliales bacterium]